MQVGVLALQGCVDPHLRMIAALGAGGVAVREAQQFKHIDRLILPGGESSTMLKLLGLYNLFPVLKEFGAHKPIWGICAGAILLAREVENPKQESLNLIAVRARRNHYGAQLESFETSLHVPALAAINSAAGSTAGDKVVEPISVQFIRAPLLQKIDADVEVLAEHAGAEVLLRKDNVLVSSFHVELGTDARLHEYFLRM